MLRPIKKMTCAMVALCFLTKVDAQEPSVYMTLTLEKA